MRSAWTGPTCTGSCTRPARRNWSACGQQALPALVTPYRGHPPEEPGSAAAVVLDPELIRARLAESERAASYLAQIFTGDDTGSQAAVPTGLDTPEDESGSAPGLDVPHRIFLTRLADRPSWTRRELDAIAAQLGLLPDGALEILNEAAFEAVGEPVCEGTDPVEINSYALKEMQG